MVLRAHGPAPEARAALGELCAAYWNPVCRFLCREGRCEDESAELTQAFFARVLAGSGLAHADPAKGRFRSYLLGALKHFLAEQKRNAGREKRGGGAALESIDREGTETSPGLQIADPAGGISDKHFDREWALAVMDRSLNTVRDSLQKAGKQAQFDILKPWLVGDTENLSQAEAAAALGASTGAVKVMIHRLRKDFRAAVEAEIAQTVPEGDDVGAELRYLIDVLS
jgi:RNA polymerase sigma-70 factor (ECF subfamily)